MLIGSACRCTTHPKQTAKQAQCPARSLIQHLLDQAPPQTAISTTGLCRFNSDSRWQWHAHSFSQKQERPSSQTSSATLSVPQQPKHNLQSSKIGGITYWHSPQVQSTPIGKPHYGLKRQNPKMHSRSRARSSRKTTG